MREVVDAELKLALAVGLISQDEVQRLREEALDLGRGPLDLLRERGRLSEGTFLSLRAEILDALPAFPEPIRLGEETPTFPVTDWDRYQCVRFLGQGGMGRVFLAHDPRLRREVALKFVRDGDPRLARRFISEARAQARVNHERVCKVYEVGEVQGRVYIAMQYIDGQPLHVLARELTVEQKVLVLRDAAEGVQEAHHAGFIHRDIKPSNIMVERTEDGALKPYVMDFGLARDWKESVTATGTVLGTPQYMAPEQARGEVATLDRRADVYSLGATLYSVLTGVPPVSGDNGLEVLNNIAAREPRPPRALLPALPVDLEAIVLKCLEKDRSARYDSARALADDLERFLSGEPIQARATGPWYRLRKHLYRHRLLASVAALALLAVGLALGWAGLQRRETLTRERLARRFTERVEQIEAMARYSALSRAHDIRADRRALRESLTELEAEIREAGAPALGPGHYALGRGLLALGEDEKAREHLDLAWTSGFREPRAAHALGIVLGRLYQRQLLEAERLRESEQRQTRKRDIEHRLRDPALDYLHQARGAPLASPRYVDALIAFYEDRLDESLEHLEAARGERSWLYEVSQLRGDILAARASRYANSGERAKALADLGAGRTAYALAAATGESVPEIPRALGELEYSALLLALYGQGELLSAFNGGIEAVTRALALDPDDPEVRVLEARFYRRRAEDLMNHGDDAHALLEKAVNSARVALTLSPERPRTLMELGGIYLQWAQDPLARGVDAREQLDQAFTAFAKVRPEARDFLFQMQLGQAYEMRSDDARQMGRDPQDSDEAAISAYRAGLQLNDRSSIAWTNLGSIYLSRATSSPSSAAKDELRQAIEALSRALTLNPEHVIACFYLAQAHAQQAMELANQGGDAVPGLEQALAFYQRGLRIKPGLPHLHNGAGGVLVDEAQALWDRGGDPFPLLDRAQVHYEQAVARAPEQGFGQNNLGRVHVNRARYELALGRDLSSEFALAVKAYQESLELLPQHPMVLINLGDVWDLRATALLGMGQDPEPALARAREVLSKAHELLPDSEDVWFQLGETRAIQARWLARRGRIRPVEFAAVAAAFQRALDLAPSSQRARLAWSRFCGWWSLWRAEHAQDPDPILELGLASVEEVLAARPTWAEAIAVRASLRLQRSETRAQAREELHRALKLNPSLAHEWKDLLVETPRPVP